MNAIQARILELFLQLTPDEKRHMLVLLQNELEAKTKPESGDWLNNLITLHGELRDQYGRNFASGFLGEMDRGLPTPDSGDS